MRALQPADVPAAAPPPGSETEGRMDYLPVFMAVRDRPCLVIGGGGVAARKVHLLLRAGARVRVVAPRLAGPLADLAAAGRVDWHPRPFAPADLEGSTLVFAATDRRRVNREVYHQACRRRVPVNVVDCPELCTFVMPAIVERSPLLVAVSSGGAAPLLSRLVRARLEAWLPRAYGRLATLVAGFREAVKRRFAHAGARKRFWEGVLDGPIAELALAGREDEARAALARALAGGPEPTPQGCVYLVGAGPGDPDLLTVRALRLIQQADAIVYDRLAAPDILDFARRDADLHYVGKACGHHSRPQHEINDLLVRLAREGRRVVRLKGGDPFIFGRGGEEVAALAAAGVPFQVVPGVTAAAGCAAYAGIPLTHRDHAQACVLVTGHLRDGSVDLDWEALARPRQTVVVYMGVSGLELLCRELTAHGLPAATPAACVAQGTTPAQRIVTATLDTLPGRVRAAGIHPPALIIVGEVVRLHEHLRWFDPAHPADEAPGIATRAAAPPA